MANMPAMDAAASMCQIVVFTLKGDGHTVTSAHYRGRQ